MSGDSAAGSLLARALGSAHGQRFLRFSLIGCFSLAIDMGTLWLLHGKVGLPLWLATTCGYLLGLTINFWLNRGVTFDSGDGHVGLQGAKYLVMVVLNYCWTLAVVSTGSLVWRQYLLSKLIATTTYSIVNFFAYQHWVFGQSRLIPAGRVRGEAVAAAGGVAVPAQDSGPNDAMTARDARA